MLLRIAPGQRSYALVVDKQDIPDLCVLMQIGEQLEEVDHQCQIHRGIRTLDLVVAEARLKGSLMDN